MSKNNDILDHGPVEILKTDIPLRKPKAGIAVCLSGGGYRAMLFHVGSLRRLYETGILKRVDRISSVSGGSIASAVLGLNWSDLMAQKKPDMARFESLIADPIKHFAGVSIDTSSVLWGILLPGSISNRVQKAYRKHLFLDATLQDLPDKPRFVINATNVQSGALWRFMKPYMRDYRVGKVSNPTIPLAAAVAASSAFPPVLSPMVMKLDSAAFTPGSGDDLQTEPYTSRVVLSDGGVYDNLGLETAWKRYDTILVSDAGGKLQPEKKPKGDWAQHSYRVLNLIDNQVRSLRKRQLIQSYVRKDRKGAYWGIRTDIADYHLNDPLDCPYEATLRLAETPTRLTALPEIKQQQLINWGYAVCDAGLRRHFNKKLSRPKDFPYPEAGVG